MQIRTIAGVRYRAITETTMEQDAAILRHVRAVGTESFEKAETESSEEFLERVLMSLIEGGHAAGLLGCFLVPEGKEWTRAVADETAAVFRAITAQEDKAQLRSILLPYLFSFFAIGLVSSMTSQKYSGLLQGVLGQPKTAGASHSGNGRRLPARSLTGILSGLWKWLAGRFARRS